MPQAPTSIIYYEIYWKAMKIPARVNKCVMVQSRYTQKPQKSTWRKKQKERPWLSEMSCKLIDERACIHRKVIETRPEKRRTVQSKRQKRKEADLTRQKTMH